MTKKQTEKYLTVEAIAGYTRQIDEQLKEGKPFREVIAGFSHLTGQKVLVQAMVQKKITRHQNPVLFIKVGTIEAFAEFTEEIQEGIKKSSTIEITGELRSLGSSAFCLTNCKILTDFDRKI